jgi:predicted site-specific integrase-resolvase
MKAKEVLNILRITRQTLTKYVKLGKIKVIINPSGRYEYDNKSVYAFINKDIEKKTYLYARVSTPKQKKDLQNQIELLKTYCFSNGININGIYSDVASGISFEKRIDFFKLLDEVIAGKVEKVIISYKDRLSRVGFELFDNLFKKFGANIIVISEVGSVKLDSEEIFEEIVSLLHCYI